MTLSSASSAINKISGGMTCRGWLRSAEESPDRKGRPAVESTDGSNLMDAVTENKPPARVRVKP